ncbi:hypothetical protein ACFV1F_07900 [Streptomyces sp. NPDC059590]|uniref:hypothetical protein n=1 Tax=Streptomyces sp. NPDC059590 TaxID=3346877 RepID=UPI00369AA997
MAATLPACRLAATMITARGAERVGSQRFLSVGPSIAGLKFGYQSAGSRTRLAAGKYTPRMQIRSSLGMRAGVSAAVSSLDMEVGHGMLRY